MADGEFGGVQGRALETTRVGQRPAVEGAIVNSLAAQRSAGFAEVDADLVRATGFEAAFDEREVAEVFNDLDVGYGTLSDPPCPPYQRGGEDCCPPF